jgi:D-alanyl-D-alanine carboxypeptidase/D-alanyl-D-alanine-endopeptidase (penicillin-binding protein 4)
VTQPTRRAQRTEDARAHRVDVRRRVVAGVLGVVAIVLVVLALRGPGEPGEGTTSPRLATPLWSVRRMPQAVVEIVGVQRLQAGLDQAVNGVNACFDVEAPAGRVAASAQDGPLIPASTQKLLTATAALDVLGRDFRYETKAVAPAAPRNGTVARMWLVGAGDPGIATPEGAARLAASPLTRGDQTSSLATLADEIVAAGVRSIPGGIAGDDSRYDGSRYLSVWPDHYRTDREIGPLGALTVNDGFTGPDGSGPAADDPAVNAAAQLTRLLQERGVTVGAAAHDTAPADATTIATLRSPPLRDILNGFLASSDNLTGELLPRELAARSDRPATTTNGLEVIKARLAGLGLPTEQLTMVDGSGLARDNRVSCSLLSATLELAQTPKFASIREGLSIAGERGTLATRFRGTPLQGKLIAKTGSLRGVSGLAGYVAVKLPIEFSLLLNGDFGESAGIARREQVAQVIAAYPDAPPADELVPAPVDPQAP